MIATSDTPRAVMHYICRSQRLDGGKCYAILTGIDYFDHRSGGAVVGGTTKQGIFLRTFRALKAGEPAYHDYFAAAHVNCVQTAVQYAQSSTTRAAYLAAHAHRTTKCATGTGLLIWRTRTSQSPTA